MPVIKIILLLVLLLFGAHVTHVAEKQVEELRLVEMRKVQFKQTLTEADYAFMKMVVNADNSLGEHGHTNHSGSLIVNKGKVIGTGRDQTSLTDPTAHSVLEAVKEASSYLGTTSLEGSVMYSNTQPCPMCLSLLYLTKVDKIIYMAPETTGQTDIELMSHRVYGSLIREPSNRTIPEVVLLPDDLK